MSAGCQRKEVKTDGRGLKQPKQLPRMELLFTGKVDYKNSRFGSDFRKRIRSLVLDMSNL